jgi:hypothetical protein
LFHNRMFEFNLSHTATWGRKKEEIGWDGSRRRAQTFLL